MYLIYVEIDKLQHLDRIGKYLCWPKNCCSSFYEFCNPLVTKYLQLLLSNESRE